MRSLVFLFIAATCCFAACEQSAQEPAQNQVETPVITDHVVLSHANNAPKLVYRYAGSDSLNRVEIGFHETGEQMTIGTVQNGQRQGEWNSFHPDGTPWSTHYYDKGKQEGLYRVYYANGQARIKGQYTADKEVGMWYFFTETGDTARTVNFDLPNAN